MRGRFYAYELLDWDNLRVPRDFDEALCLELNPDLADINMDLRKHHLLRDKTKIGNIAALMSPISPLPRYRCCGGSSNDPSCADSDLTWFARA